MLFGTDIPQEYLCLALDGIRDPLKIIFNSGGHKLNITGKHLLLGYKPVIIGVVFEKNINVSDLKNAEINFIEPDSNKTIAVLKLEIDSVSEFLKNNLAVYKCTHGSNKFINPIQKQLTMLNQKFEKKKMGNVNLPGNLYEQVKIAYSVPRKICLISLGESGSYNMFPTDLNGKIDDENYVISLRTDGKANSQVNKFSKITLSAMNLDRYKYVYSMGKNHMQELKSKGAFEFSEILSEQYDHPLPIGTVSYLELEHTNSKTSGMHNLNYFKVTNSKLLNNTEPVLSHIHRMYASRLLKKNINVSFMVR